MIKNKIYLINDWENYSFYIQGSEKELENIKKVCIRDVEYEVESYIRYYTYSDHGHSYSGRTRSYNILIPMKNLKYRARVPITQFLGENIAVRFVK